MIDHATTTAEAAGSEGGRRGRGGELLYRWGNPAAWGAGGAADRRLFAPHDARWIPPGQPGRGQHPAVQQRPGAARRTALLGRRDPAATAAGGGYRRPVGEPFGPAAPVWIHREPRFFSARLSGAQRLPNGNTLICAGEQGRIFEVTPGGEIVWEYSSPFGHDGHQLARKPSLREPLAGPAGIGARGSEPSQFGYSLFRATRLPVGYPGLAGLTVERPPARPEIGP